MNNIEFNAYVNDTISLLRTLVIKCEALAVNDNDLIAKAGFTVSSDKRYWRYYLNMNGQYHETDDIMTVVSLDNGETIEFTKENLSVHLATLRTYQPGGYWYRRLIDTYPHQTELINGILDPIDIDTAIKAKDYKIMRYNKNLVGINEEQLIPKMQEWIDVFKYKNMENNAYLKIENMMLPLMISLMYGMLIPVVLTIRLEANGTRHVHDHYIWSRLNSYGVFDNYRRLLTNNQKMWLYRNIEWLNNTTGQQHTFDAILDNLLTPAQIPVSHYNALINTKDILEDGVGTGNYVKNALNFSETTADDNQFLSIEEMMNKEINLALDNASERVYIEEEMNERLRYSLFSNASTKVLDSSMEDYSNRHTITMMKTLMHEWVYLVKHDKYKAVLDVVNPQTGETLKLSAKEGLMLWQYLITRISGRDTTYIQPFFYQHVLKIKPPTLETIMDAGGIEYLPKYLCQDIRNLWFESPVMISPEAFFEHCFKVFDVLWKGTKVYAKFMDIYCHARTKEAVNRLFERGVVLLNDEDQPYYDVWLKERELNLTDMSEENLELLAWEIFKAGTSWDTKAGASLRKVQGALIQIMKDLSSYTIQFAVEMSDGNTTIEGNQRISMGFGTKNKSSNVSDLLGIFKFPHNTHLVSDFSLETTFKNTSNNDISGELIGGLNTTIRCERNMAFTLLPAQADRELVIERFDSRRKLTEVKAVEGQ